MAIDEDFIEAIDKIADTSFDAGKASGQTFGANRIARRPSFGSVKGFYRPGERRKDGAPFKVSPTKCPEYQGPPTGRPSTEDEKRGAWQLREEYVAGRLGRTPEENSRLWNTVKWIDKHFRIATMDATATQTMNLSAGSFMEVANTDEIKGRKGENAGFGVLGLKVDERDMKRLALKLSDYDLSCLMDDFAECDYLGKVDVEQMVGKSDPLLERMDFPDQLDREDSGAIIRNLMGDMGPLWRPVKRAIFDHATMKELGREENKGAEVAAAVGRQRVVDGMRLAESIRKRRSRQERCFSMWLSQVRTKQTPVRSNRIQVPSVDEIIKGTVACLPDRALPKPVRAKAGHYWNQSAGPVIKIPDNDNLADVSRAA